MHFGTMKTMFFVICSTKDMQVLLMRCRLTLSFVRLCNMYLFAAGDHLAFWMVLVSLVQKSRSLSLHLFSTDGTGICGTVRYGTGRSYGTVQGAITACAVRGGRVWTERSFCFVGCGCAALAQDEGWRAPAHLISCGVYGYHNFDQWPTFLHVVGT